MPAAATMGFTTAERDELRRLRRENRDLREEREILREAVVFFPGRPIAGELLSVCSPARSSGSRSTTGPPATCASTPASDRGGRARSRPPRLDPGAGGQGGERTGGGVNDQPEQWRSVSEECPEDLRERTSAGLAAARACGRHGGRPSVMTARPQDPGSPGDVRVEGVHGRG
jgi:hypothetical protein